MLTTSIHQSRVFEDAGEFGGAQLSRLAVVGEQAVDLALDIARLGVDAAGDACFSEIGEHLDRGFVAFDPFLLVLGQAAVASVFCVGVP